MSNKSFNTNPYLTKLLQYQQDGVNSISGPETWAQEELISVETELTKNVDDLVAKVSVEGETTWHFYIGAPGNGKSHLIGMIYRQLLADQWSINQDNLSDTGGDSSYLYRCKKPESKRDNLWLLQDASAVRNKFDQDGDEARDTVELIAEAKKKSVSLIICANRGILERIHSQHCGTDRFRDLKKIVEWLISEHDESEKNFDGISVRRDFLDSVSSISLGSSEDSPFLQVLDQVANDANWRSCEECAAAAVCPFYGNKIDLSESQTKDKFLEILRNAELLAGQTLVFREYLALISLVFSGNNYTQSYSPCSWVSQQVNSNNLVALMSRRYYMTLFAADISDGLDRSPAVRTQQIEKLDQLRKRLERTPISQEDLSILNSFLNEREMYSANVGISRLLGEAGYLSIQDPLLANIGHSVFNSYSLDTGRVGSTFDSGADNVSNLESVFAHSLERLNEKLEDSENEALDAELRNFGIRVTQRWHSAFSFRQLGLKHGHTVFSSEIKEFEETLRSIQKLNQMEMAGNASEEYGDIQLTINDREEKLDASLRSLEGNLVDAEESIQLSDTLAISGRPIAEASILRIHTKGFTAPFLNLPCVFGEPPQRGEPHIFLSGYMYCWLMHAQDNNMHSASVPHSIVESISQAKSRAISHSDYSRKDRSAANVKVSVFDSSTGTSHQMVILKGGVARVIE